MRHAAFVLWTGTEMQPLTLPKLSAEESAFAREAIGTARVFDVRIGDQSFQLRCEQAERRESNINVELSVGDSSAWLSSADFGGFPG